MLPGHLVEGIVYYDTGPVVLELNEQAESDGINPRLTNETQPSLSIFGGNPAPYGKYPQVCQFVSVFDEIDGFRAIGAFCSATIINEVTIMTNAHCIAFFEGFLLRYRRVYCGVVNSPLISRVIDYYHQFRDVTSITIHPQFVPYRQGFPFVASIEYDVALMQLDIPLLFNDFVQPSNLWNGVDRIPRDCMHVGFGSSENAAGGTSLSPVMREITTKIRSDLRCRLFDDPFVTPYTDNNICFFNSGPEVESPCPGDSGGLNLCGDFQVGIITYGRIGCGNPSYGGSMNIGRFFDWIRENSFKP